MCNLNIDYEKINERISLIRKEEDITQQTFADRISVSRSFVSRMESGKEKPSESLLKLIALEFGINEEWLLIGTGEMYSDVYENDREEASKVANRTLLDIMQLLNVNSNIAYTSIVYGLSFATDILNLGRKPLEEYNLDYLEEANILFANIHRCLSIVRFSEEECVDEKHINAVIDSLHDCIKKIVSNRDLK